MSTTGHSQDYDIIMRRYHPNAQQFAPGDRKKCPEENACGHHAPIWRKWMYTDVAIIAKLGRTLK